MAECDYTNIAAASISTPSSGVTATYVELTSPAKRLSSKDDVGTVINYTGITSTDRLTNKDLDDSTTTISNVSAASKAIKFSSSGATASTVLTLSNTQSTSQTLSFPNITGADTLSVLSLAQSITGVKTMTNMTTAAGTTGVPSMTLTGGTNMTTPTAGVVEFDGAAFYKTSDTTNGRSYDDKWSLFRLGGNGSAISTIADFFGSNDGIPTVLNGVYEIEWHCYFTVATGGTSTWTIVNTQTVTNMVARWQGCVITGISATGAMSSAAVVTQTAASVALPVTGSLSAASHYYIITALIEAGTAGNVRLRQTMSAGTSTPLRDSYFKVRRLPAGNAGTFVA